MSNDPFKNFQPLNVVKKKSHKRPVRGDSFVEQLKSLGSSVTDSLKTDVVKGAAQGIYEQLIGSAKSGQTPSETQSNQARLEEWVREREQTASAEADQEARSQERAHFDRQRQTEKVLFSFADEQLRQEINQVRQELAQLVKSMGKVEQEIEAAVMQEIVNPGLYHKNFFANLKSWLYQMRKSMEDASLWLSTATSRKQQGYFWQQTKKSGTMFSQSQERSKAFSG